MCECTPNIKSMYCEKCRPITYNTTPTNIKIEHAKNVVYQLRGVQERYKDEFIGVGEVRRSDMARDAANVIESLLVEFKSYDHEEAKMNRKAQILANSMVIKQHKKERECVTVDNAIDVLRTEFLKHQSEGSYYHSWVSNIVCCIMNHSNIEHDKANNAAKAFMRLLTGQGEN